MRHSPSTTNVSAQTVALIPARATAISQRIGVASDVFFQSTFAPMPFTAVAQCIVVVGPVGHLVESLLCLLASTLVEFVGQGLVGWAVCCRDHALNPDRFRQSRIIQQRRLHRLHSVSASSRGRQVDNTFDKGKNFSSRVPHQIERSRHLRYQKQIDPKLGVKKIAWRSNGQ